MKNLLASTILAFGVMSSGAPAQEIDTTIGGKPVRTIARLADQGLGYSVLYAGQGVPFRPHRVLVTCTIGEASSITYCPTVNYEAYCPNARIACR